MVVLLTQQRHIHYTTLIYYTIKMLLNKKMRAFYATTIIICSVSGVFLMGDVLLRKILFVGEDSWGHYTSGGEFLKEAPSGYSDGRKLVYASVCTGHGDIYTRTTLTKSAIQMTTGQEFDASPIYSPDGSRIAFSKEKAGRRTIWMMNGDGTSQQEVTRGDVVDDPREFSPDGHHLLFYRTESSLIGHGKAAYAVSINLSLPDRSMRRIGKLGSIAAYTPKSDSVVFTENSEDLWLIDLNGRNENRRRHPGRGWPLGFSTDGRYFLTLRPSIGVAWDGENEIWIRDLRLDSERLVGTGSSAVIFGLSDVRVFYMKGVDQIPYVTDTEGRNTTRIEMPHCRKTIPRLALDGKGILFGSSIKGGSPEYSICCIDAERGHVSIIHSVACNREAARTRDR